MFRSLHYKTACSSSYRAINRFLEVVVVYLLQGKIISTHYRAILYFFCVNLKYRL